MKLWTEKKLVIGGDIMASQKLMFLKKIDRARAAEVVARLRGAGGETRSGAGAGAGEATSAEAFGVIRDHVERSAGIVGEVGKTFLFRLSEPTSAWLVDLKNGSGAVTEATAETKADCTLDLSDADFGAMVAGKADPMKLWTEKKLKIGGDIMASQKLMFLKKIDRARAAEVVAKLRGAGGDEKRAPGAGAGAGAGEKKSAQAPGIVAALGKRLAETKGLAKEVGAVVGLVVTDPEGAWTLDITGEGKVAEGKPSSAAVTLTLTDADLVALAKGETLRDLYQHGRVRLDGDARIAQKLGFWKGLV